MQSFEKILSGSLAPWAEDAAKRIIVAQDAMKSSSLPDGVRLEKRKLRGRRQVVQGRRFQGVRTYLAYWPDCLLNEVALLKLACVVSGACRFQLGNQVLLCGPGHFIVIPPGMPHPCKGHNIIDTRVGTSCDIVYFLAHPHALQIWGNHHPLEDSEESLSPNLLFQNNCLMQQFQTFMREAIAHPERIKTQERLFQAFILLLQGDVRDGLYMETNTGKIGDAMSRNSATESFADELTHYIQSHLKERPSLQDAARAMYLSRTQFARKGRDETGKTYGELLTEQRVEIAKTLLEGTDWTVETIAQFLGFKNQYYFHKMFHQFTNSTPDGYRKAIVKNVQ